MSSSDFTGLGYPFRINSQGGVVVTTTTNNDSITIQTSDGENTCELKITPKGVSVNGRNL